MGNASPAHVVTNPVANEALFREASVDAMDASHYHAIVEHPPRALRPRRSFTMRFMSEDDTPDDVFATPPLRMSPPADISTLPFEGATPATQSTSRKKKVSLREEMLGTEAQQPPRKLSLRQQMLGVDPPPRSPSFNTRKPRSKPNKKRLSILVPRRTRAFSDVDTVLDSPNGSVTTSLGSQEGKEFLRSMPTIFTRSGELPRATPPKPQAGSSTTLLRASQRFSHLVSYSGTTSYPSGRSRVLCGFLHCRPRTALPGHVWFGGRWRNLPPVLQRIEKSKVWLQTILMACILVDFVCMLLLAVRFYCIPIKAVQISAYDDDQGQGAPEGSGSCTQAGFYLYLLMYPFAWFLSPLLGVALVAYDARYGRQFMRWNLLSTVNILMSFIVGAIWAGDLTTEHYELAIVALVFKLLQIRVAGHYISLVESSVRNEHGWSGHYAYIEDWTDHPLAYAPTVVQWSLFGAAPQAGESEAQKGRHISDDDDQGGMCACLCSRRQRQSRFRTAVMNSPQMPSRFRKW